MATAGTLEIDVVLNGKKARLGINELKKRLGVLNKTANTSNKIFGKLAKIASIGFLAKMTLDTAKLNRELGLMAERTGMSVETLSKMRNSFKMIGGDAKVVDRVMSRISSGIARAFLGDGEFIGALSSLGISGIKNGKAVAPDVVLGQIADFIKREKSIGRSDEQIFTRLQSFIPEMDFAFYKQLSEGSAKYFESVKKANSLTEKEIEDVAKLEVAWQKLKSTLGVVADKIEAVLAPVLTAIADILSDIADWAGKHEIITTSIAALVGLATAIKGLTIASSVATGLKALTGGLVGLKALGAVGATGAVGAAGAAGAVGLGTIAFWSAVAGILGHEITYETVTAFKKLTQSQEEKDNELATKANQMKFKNIDEKLRWLSEQDSDYWKSVYAKHMKSKYGISVFGGKDPLNGYHNPAEIEKLIAEGQSDKKTGKDYEIIVDYDGIYNDDYYNEQKDLLSKAYPEMGTELAKAMQNNASTVYVDVENNITDNGNSSYTIETDTDVNNGFSSFTQKAYNSITGVGGR